MVSKQRYSTINLFIRSLIFYLFVNNDYAIQFCMCVVVAIAIGWRHAIIRVYMRLYIGC